MKTTENTKDCAKNCARIPPEDYEGKGGAATAATCLSFPAGLVDKYGHPIWEDDVICDGENYFRIYWNSKQPQVEAISPTYGYLHDLSQGSLKKFERIGTFEECEHLITVD